jgi:hypothetical protein
MSHSYESLTADSGFLGLKILMLASVPNNTKPSFFSAKVKICRIGVDIIMV